MMDLRLKKGGQNGIQEEFLTASECVCELSSLVSE